MQQAEWDLDGETYLQVVVVDWLVVQNVGLHGSQHGHSIKLSSVPKHIQDGQQAFACTVAYVLCIWQA